MDRLGPYDVRCLPVYETKTDSLGEDNEPYGPEWMSMPVCVDMHVQRNLNLQSLKYTTLSSSKNH